MEKTAEQIAREVVDLASKNINNGAAMNSSAILCLQDARQCLAGGLYYHAQGRALRSLSYSVGVFHQDYQTARKLVPVGNI